MTTPAAVLATLVVLTVLAALGIRALLAHYDRTIEARQQQKTQRHEAFLRFLTAVRDARHIGQ